eukprot:COSAG02_NODE_74_length_41878_cov_9.737954_12_plen_439_part_00
MPRRRELSMRSIRRRRLGAVAVGLGLRNLKAAATVSCTGAAEARGRALNDARQLLWAGGDALPDVPDPQFRTDSAAGRPRLHTETGDPRGPAELLDPARRSQLLAQYMERGYVVCRDFLSQQQVAECRDTISRIIDDWPERTDPEITNMEGPPFVDLDPRVVAGEVIPASPELAVRRIFRLATHSDFFRRLLVDDSTVLDFTKSALGPDLKLVQSMALLKPPGTGEKRWHQDTGVMRLTPNTVLGWWVALDAADVGNGCMQLWPKSHQRGIVTHDLPVRSSPAAHIYYSVRDPPPPDEAVAVPMTPGDALIFNVSCVHGSGPNTTSLPRWAMQMQYAPSHCRVTHCPEEGSAEARALGITKVTRATDSEVFAHAHRAETTQDAERDVAFAPTATITRGDQHATGAGVFDCECVEPQYWSYRKAEMYVCGRDDFGPDAI